MGKRVREWYGMCPPGPESVRRSETPSGNRSEPVRIWLLGGFRVSVGSRTIHHDEWRLRKAASLLKLLALAPSHRLHREQVMDLLWPDSGRRAASNSLRKTLHAARKVLDPTVGSRYLASKDESLILCPGEQLWVDVDAFEEAAATARRGKDTAAYRAAVELYAGDLLPEDRYEEWVESSREELRQLYLALLIELARLYEERHEIAYTRVFCEGWDEGGFGTCVYKMFANGLGQTNLTRPEDYKYCQEGGASEHYGFSEDPSWSPDGSQIAYDGPLSCEDASTELPANSGRDVWVMSSSDGSEKKNLIQDDGTSDWDASWSPDGSKIAFSSDRGGDPHGNIYMMDANGEDPLSGLKRLNSQDGWDVAPDWGPPPRAISIPQLAFTEEALAGTKPCSYSTNPGQPLRFLSVDEHDFFDADGKPDATPDGNARIYGTITVKGTPGDALRSLELEIVKGQDIIRAQLAPAARTALIKPFPSSGTLQITKRQLLCSLPSAQAARFNTTTNTVLTLRVKAITQRGGTTTKTYSYKDPKTGQVTTNVQQLVLYDGANRYDKRNENEGGDGWVFPSLQAAAAALGQVNPVTNWGDFSNMNGGAICPHSTHQEGYDVDGNDVAPNGWYDARDAATANKILDMLREPNHGTRIKKVYVTYNKPGATNLLNCEGGNTDSDHSAFYNAIQNQMVPAPGGGTRSATSVIRPVAQHCVHFHIQFFPYMYSAVGDFSATQTPIGAWCYGSPASGGSGFTLYTNHSTSYAGLDRWSLGAPEPMVAYNSTGKPLSYATIVHPLEMLNLHPGPAGEKSVVRWTAPENGRVKIEGRFEGIDTHGTTTDVAVLKNTGTTLFGGNINDYGATAPFLITKQVAAGDTIDFSVGYGSNANYGFDSTGLSVTITPT
jgi:hypothetical protein